MRKGKVGLQKEISRIFTGIQVPKKDAPEYPHPAVHPATPAPPAPSSAAPPVTQRPATPPVVPPPTARPAVPKTITPAPKPFTIPEPPQQTTIPANKTVYEKPAPIPDEYLPPAKSQKLYEPPQKPLPASEVIKAPLGHKQPWQLHFLKSLQGLVGKYFASKHSASSTKQKVAVILMPVLAIVFIVVLSNVLKKPQAKTGPAPSNKNSASAGDLPSDPKVGWEIPPSLPDNLRDPTGFGYVASQNKQDEGRPAVKGIVFSEDHPCAVVGDRIISVGETVQGATVVKINPNSVEFSKGEQKWTQEVER
jgi:hypothetical protein